VKLELAQKQSTAISLVQFELATATARQLTTQLEYPVKDGKFADVVGVPETEAPLVALKELEVCPLEVDEGIGGTLVGERVSANAEEHRNARRIKRRALGNKKVCIVSWL